MGMLGTTVRVYQATMVKIVKKTSMSVVLIRVEMVGSVMMK